MRRTDREITDTAEVYSILSRCETVRVGLFDGECPYIVPVSFGIAGNVLYFHSAKEGRKLDCIKKSSAVCIEADIFHAIDKERLTTYYESVMGTGIISEATGDEKLFGLRKILEHYGCADYLPENCASFDRTAVFKIVLNAVSGKKNIK